MKEYTYDIKLINNDLEEKEFNCIKNYCLNKIKYMAKTYLPWDCTIEVHFVANGTKNQNMAAVAVQNKHYVLKIAHTLINWLFGEEFRFFDSALNHEFQHIVDYQRALDCPHTKYKVNKSNFKSKVSYFATIGFHFWAEFRAYTVSFYTSLKKDIDNKTFYQSVLELRKINKKADKINAMETNPTNEIYDQFKDELDEFVYEFTKYLAFFYLNKDNKEYSKKTEEIIDFWYLKDFLYNALKIINKINKSPFNKNFNKNFISLGMLIFKYFYEPYRFKLVLHNKEWALSCDL